MTDKHSVEYVTAAGKDGNKLVRAVFESLEAATTFAEYVGGKVETTHESEIGLWLFKAGVVLVMACSVLGMLPLLWEIVKGLFLSP